MRGFRFLLTDPRSEKKKIVPHQIKILKIDLAHRRLKSASLCVINIEGVNSPHVIREGDRSKTDFSLLICRLSNYPTLQHALKGEISKLHVRQPAELLLLPIGQLHRLRRQARLREIPTGPPSHMGRRNLARPVEVTTHQSRGSRR